MSEPEQHWPTERMINEGYADFATHEDLEGVADERLIEIAEVCKVTEAAPDECIPCWAYAEFLERQQTKLEEMAPKDPVVEAEMAEIEEEPKLDVLADEADVFTPPEMKPIAEQFADKVEELSVLAQELLHGPPIPPKDVSMADLALLVLAADRWIKMTEAQGVELSGQPRQVLDSTRDLVSRLRA